MGQTWVVVAIVAGVGIALLFFLRNRGDAAPNAKLPPPKEGKSPLLPSGKAGGDKPPDKASDKASDKPADKKPADKKPADKKPAEKKSEDKKPAAAAEKKSEDKKSAAPFSVPKAHLDDPDDDEITIVTLTPRSELPHAGGTDEEEGPDSERPAAVPIIYDEEAAEDEPTRAHAVILLSAVGQTDLGQKRKVNEDRYLVLEEENLYVVADGMGGHAGGEIASQLAVDVIAEAFNSKKFEGEPYTNVPRRGGELALAIQMANKAIFEKAKQDSKLSGMGTTIVSARFTPGKERVYIGHVGDSRCYRFRAGQLTQITTDHTMGAVGMTGPFADHLSRAVGIGAAVKVDMIIAKPRHEDVFMLCSDGLSKMVKHEVIREVLAAHSDPNEAVAALVEKANQGGGRDNITAILVVIKDPKGFTEHVVAQARKKQAAEAAAAGATRDDAPNVEAVPASEASSALVEEADRVSKVNGLEPAKSGGARPSAPGSAPKKS